MLQIRLTGKKINEWSRHIIKVKDNGIQVARLKRNFIGHNIGVEFHRQQNTG